MKLEEAVKYATDLLLSLPKKTKIRIIGHIDADGIASASIVAIALARAGYRFHISIKKTEPDLIKEIKKEDNDLVIFVDIGSSYLEEMRELKNVIVLEHHLGKEEAPSNVMYLNARFFGLDGSKEACGASVAYAFALALDEENVDLSQLAIVGIIGDKQQFIGYNKKIVEDGIGSGFIEERDEYILVGKSLKEALENSLEPYFTGFYKSSASFLDKLGIQPQKKFEELEDEDRRKLLSALTLKLLEQDVDEIAWRKRIYYGKNYGNLYDISSKLNACARLNEAGVGIAICLGDKKAIDVAHVIQEKYRDEIRKEMREMEKKEPYEKNNFIYFYTDKAPLAGVLAGLALKYLPNFKKDKPILALSYNEFIDVSARADDKMVENGVNLGEALKLAAEKVGGIGGGHPVAAGAKIRKDKEEEFLEEVDKLLK